MRRKRKSSSLGWIALLLSLVLIGLIGYSRVGPQAVSVRDQIEKAITSAKESSKLTPDREAMLRVHIALVDYTTKHGIAPENLGELVPVYFDSVPKNPVTKEPFFYERNGRVYTLRASEGEDLPETQVASLNTKSPSDSSDGTTDSIDDADFVNPNTLQIEEFLYDPSSKRDPFLPFDLSPQVMDGAGTPLEAYDLGQLRLTAVLSSSSGDTTAIVENAAGRGFTVRPGTKIGNAGGVIVKIESNHLKILESNVDFTGTETQRVVEMKLQKPTLKDKKRRKKNN